MKKFLAVFAVLALVCISSVAFALDTTVSGMISIRSRDYSNLTLNKDDPTGGQVDTQEKIRLEVNVKASDDLRGKISIENYWDTWGRLENYQGSGGNAAPNGTTSVGGDGPGQSQFLKVREAWVSFNLPGIPVNVTGGHQLLSLGNAWFLRSLYFGSDAWVVANVTGPNTFALVDIKVLEGQAYNASDDADAYAVLDVFKINENNTVGIDVANVKTRAVSHVNLINVSLNYNGKVGPVGLHGQLDVQSGKVEDTPGEPKFKGNEIVVQGNIPVDPVTINFTVARGSGAKDVSGTTGLSTETDVNEFINFLDIDQHYTALYEYKIGGPCGLHTGFCNTTALSAGVAADVTKSLNVGVDLWYLQATEKVFDVKNGSGTTSDLGTEADLHVNWKLYDNLTWNWTLAYFDPGAGMGKDAATGIQGYLTFKF